MLQTFGPTLRLVDQKAATSWVPHVSPSSLVARAQAVQITLQLIPIHRRVLWITATAVLAATPSNCQLRRNNLLTFIMQLSSIIKIKR